jgi:hypothetical protein
VEVVLVVDVLVVEVVEVLAVVVVCGRVVDVVGRVVVVDAVDEVVDDVEVLVVSGGPSSESSRIAKMISTAATATSRMATPQVIGFDSADRSAGGAVGAVAEGCSSSGRPSAPTIGTPAAGVGASTGGMACVGSSAPVRPESPGVPSTGSSPDVLP